MSEWQTQFELIRQQFFARANPRIVKTGEAVDALAKNPSDMELLASVRRDMHWLAGVGGTYKLPEITEIGENGELVCDTHLESSTALSTEEVSTLRSFVDRARSIFESESI